MAAKSKKDRLERRMARADAFRNRVPRQPDGMPQGKHLGGIGKKKMICLCGGCYLSNKNKVVIEDIL